MPFPDLCMSERRASEVDGAVLTQAPIHKHATDLEIEPVPIPDICMSERSAPRGRTCSPDAGTSAQACY